MLNGTNFKAWKEVVEIIIGCMDLDLALRVEKPTPTLENPDEDKVEKGNIREYIMEMSNLVTKLKALKLELSDDLLVHLVLISLPTHFGQFNVSYNTQKDKWTLNELISHYVQEEERQQREKIENAHLVSSSQNRKRKNNKDVVERTSQYKKVKKDENTPTCFFCKKPRHDMKKECPKYASWRVKKGNFLSFVCFEVNFAFEPHDTWWVDFGATTNISVSMQVAFGAYRQVIMKDLSMWVMEKKVIVEAIGTFRL
uniref:Retrovirus-related Pol polyprotein from transposon TNT 1-94 n=1 Tax=Cajanus cajan TaxID=3821 RepID=A0A151R4A1_CAJCA|nr:hypothetical protein KK1_041400 [Cajanus cajan]